MNSKRPGRAVDRPDHVVLGERRERAAERHERRQRVELEVAPEHGGDVDHVAMLAQALEPLREQSLERRRDGGDRRVVAVAGHRSAGGDHLQQLLDEQRHAVCSREVGIEAAGRDHRLHVAVLSGPSASVRVAGHGGVNSPR